MSSEAASHNNKFVIDTFLNLGDIELKRAERYRVFVTMIRFDLSVIDRLFPENANAILDQIVDFAQGKIRGSDMISSTSRSIAILIPETPRQGAEVTSRRLRDLLKERLSEMADKDVADTIPLELASYPDTAGARPMADFLKDLAAMSKN
jgi:hypothetical protein